MNGTQRRAIGLLFAGVVALSGCSGEEASTEGEVSSPDPAAEGGAAEPEDTGSGPENSEASEDSESGALQEALADRDIVLQALEAAMSGDNASGEWDGDVLKISLDGDVDDEVKRFQHCRIVGNFLEDGDTLVLDYENGSIDCAEIPELEGQLIW